MPLLRDALFPAPHAALARRSLAGDRRRLPGRAAAARDDAALRQMLRRGVSIIDAVSHHGAIGAWCGARCSGSPTATGLAARPTASPRDAAPVPAPAPVADEVLILAAALRTRRGAQAERPAAARRPIKQTAGDVEAVSEESSTRAFRDWTGHQGPAAQPSAHGARATTPPSARPLEVTMPRRPSGPLQSRHRACHQARTAPPSRLPFMPSAPTGACHVRANAARMSTTSARAVAHHAGPPANPSAGRP